MRAAAFALARAAPARAARSAFHAASCRGRGGDASTSASSRAARASPPVGFPRRSLARCHHHHQHHHLHRRRAALSPRATSSSSSSSRWSSVRASPSAPRLDDHVEIPNVGDVHLWFADLAEVASDPDLASRYASSLLSPAERAALDAEGDALTADARTRRDITSKAFTRAVLARYLGRGIDPADLTFAIGPHGKPRLMGAEGTRFLYRLNNRPDARRIRYSLSHCDRLAVLAVTSAPAVEDVPLLADIEAENKTPLNEPFRAVYEIGVDCEDERRRTSASADALARRWLSAAEAARLDAIEDDDVRATAFMRLWTLKEAYVKALGTGIAAHALSGFDVAVTRGEEEEEGSKRLNASTTSSGGDRGGGGVGLDRASDAPGSIALTERGDVWESSADRWRFALVRPTPTDSLVAAVCVWGGGGVGEEEAEEGGGGGGEVDADDDAATRAPTIISRWFVPLVKEDAERPPPEVIAVSSHFRAS